MPESGECAINEEPKDMFRRWGDPDEGQGNTGHNGSQKENAEQRIDGMISFRNDPTRSRSPAVAGRRIPPPFLQQFTDVIVKKPPPGRIIIMTPQNPTRTAAQPNRPTFSPRKIAASTGGTTGWMKKWPEPRPSA